MPAHPELIAAFHAGLATGLVPPGASADRAEIARRFAVYRNNVSHSLTEALASRFPVVRQLVGDDFFRAMARVFIAAHKPKTPVLAFWGEEFAGFLRGFAPAAGLPYLADVARLEYALGLACHAADAAPIPAEALSRAAHGAGTALVGLHPSVRLLRARHAFVTIWQAHQPGAAIGEISADSPETALILRNRQLDVEVWALEPGDAHFVDHLGKTGALLSAAVLARIVEPHHDPARIILRLATAGALVSREVSNA